MYELELELYLNSCMIAFSRYLNERINKSSVNKLLRLFLFRVLLVFLAFYYFSYCFDHIQMIPINLRVFVLI